MVRIPAEYQEVEYLESTGTQWIDTGYVPVEDTWVDAEYGFSGTYSGEQVILGASSSNYTGSNTTGLTVELYNHNRWYCGCGGSIFKNVLTGFGEGLYIKHRVILSKDSLTVDGNIQSRNSSATFDPSQPCYLYAINAYGIGAQRLSTTLRLYSVKLYENKNIMRNLIPCYRKSDNEPGMYDTVSGAFYTNNGTGTFLVGNPIEYSTINLLELRRLALLYDSHWNYFFKAEEYGRIPKARIPLKSGQRVYIEWDTSRLASKNQTVFSFYNQVSSMNDVCKGWSKGGYPICWEFGDIGNDIFRVGHAMLIMPKDLTMFIGYWQDSDTSDRRIYADYLKIKIL